jgi:hypothetical protein
MLSSDRVRTANIDNYNLGVSDGAYPLSTGANLSPSGA